jgi:hypothetical protein
MTLTIALNLLISGESSKKEGKNQNLIRGYLGSRIFLTMYPIKGLKVD